MCTHLTAKYSGMQGSLQVYTLLRMRRTCASDLVTCHSGAAVMTTISCGAVYKLSAVACPRIWPLSYAKLKAPQQRDWDSRCVLQCDSNYAVLLLRQGCNVITWQSCNYVQSAVDDPCDCHHRGDSIHPWHDVSLPKQPPGQGEPSLDTCCVSCSAGTASIGCLLLAVLAAASRAVAMLVKRTL